MQAMYGPTNISVHPGNKIIRINWSHSHRLSILRVSTPSTVDQTEQKVNGARCNWI